MVAGSKQMHNIGASLEAKFETQMSEMNDKIDGLVSVLNGTQYSAISTIPTVLK